MEALFQIARKANLEVAFDADFFDSDLTITLQQNSITVGEALEAVLKGTGYESLITMNHQILLREVVPEIVEEPVQQVTVNGRVTDADSGESLDRKSTRLNSSHVAISYAVFCLKKKTEPVR